VAAAATASLVVPPWSIGGDDLAAHMTRHLVLLEAVPLLVLVGLGPQLRRRLDVRALPAGVAATALLLVWHLPPVFDAALARPWLHVLEHVSLLAVGVLLWIPVLSARTGTAAGLAFLFLTRNAQAVLGNVLLFAPRPLYEESGSLHDQRVAAAIMLGEGLLVGLLAAAWLFARLLRDQGSGSRAAAGPGRPRLVGEHD
jgi:cytochrome c oxidase assembly factor CtaG